jgi:putative transposase
MIQMANQLSLDVGKSDACDAFLVSRATFYRHENRDNHKEETSKQRSSPPLALSPEEHQTAIDILHSDRFLDDTPYQIYATLLDEGHYHCSIRTMYRLLAEEHGCVKERRKHVRHQNYVKPELLATSQNQVWSWDITKLKGPVKWTYYHLYVIIDIFSRYVVGWMIANREKNTLAKQLIEDSCGKQNIEQDQLVVHADRGPSR